jgi:hypothetical protein
VIVAWGFWHYSCKEILDESIELVAEEIQRRMDVLMSSRLSFPPIIGTISVGSFTTDDVDVLGHDANLVAIDRYTFLTRLINSVVDDASCFFIS